MHELTTSQDNLSKINKLSNSRKETWRSTIFMRSDALDVEAS